MTAWAQIWATEQPVRQPMRRFVLWALAFHLNENHTQTWPGQKCLADETGLSERAVRDHLKALEADGTIRRMPRYDARGKRTYDAWELIGYPEWLALRLKEHGERRRLAADAAGSTTGRSEPHYRQIATPLPADRAAAPYMNQKERKGTSGAPARAGGAPARAPERAAARKPADKATAEAQAAAATAQARAHWQGCLPKLRQALEGLADRRALAEARWRDGREALVEALGKGEAGEASRRQLEADLVPWSLDGLADPVPTLTLRSRSLKRFAAYPEWRAEAVLGAALGMTVAIKALGPRDPAPIDPNAIMRVYLVPLMCERGNALRLRLAAGSDVLADGARRWLDQLIAVTGREVEIVVRAWALERSFERETMQAQGADAGEAAPCG